eukprot:m.4731 g.4731  ORF g.4731 m.4731 type:complete len:306 (+) comp3077_c0_seq1:298-1215(+)
MTRFYAFNKCLRVFPRTFIARPTRVLRKEEQPSVRTYVFKTGNTSITKKEAQQIQARSESTGNAENKQSYRMGTDKHSGEWDIDNGNVNNSHIMDDNDLPARNRKKKNVIYRCAPPHPTELTLDALMRECELKHTKRGGPGGQHRNKTSTAVVLKHISSGVRGEGYERRSQLQNLKTAQNRLRLSLALYVRVTLADDGGTFLWTPSQKLLERVNRSGHIIVSVDHPDFALIVSNILDGLDLYHYDISKFIPLVAKYNIGYNSLMTVLQKDSKVFQFVNHQRALLNLPPLVSNKVTTRRKVNNKTS